MGNAIELEFVNSDLERCVALLELIQPIITDVSFADEEELRKAVFTIETLAVIACKELKEITHAIKNRHKNKEDVKAAE